MVEFEFKPTNFDHDGWTSIFHMTIGGDVATIGDRIPAVFYHPSQGLTIDSHNNETPNYAEKRYGSPPIGNWTKIRVSQELLDGKFRYRMFIKAFICWDEDHTLKFHPKNILYISLESKYNVYLWKPAHSRYKIFINEREETNMENSAAVEFENVKVFAADPFHEAQPGSIKNLKINVKGN